ncbi:hypothetical protein STEG23_016983, partial [Scotinomys teguina]
MQGNSIYRELFAKHTVVIMSWNVRFKRWIGNNLLRIPQIPDRAVDQTIWRYCNMGFIYERSRVNNDSNCEFMNITAMSCPEKENYNYNYLVFNYIQDLQLHTFMDIYMPMFVEFQYLPVYVYYTFRCTCATPSGNVSLVFPLHQ